MSGWKDIISVSAGDYHTVALDKNGKVHTTPTDSEKDDAEVESWENVVAVSAGYGYTIALTDEGNVLSVGNEADG